jgi:hypothetical protein
MEKHFETREKKEKRESPNFSGDSERFPQNHFPLQNK